MNRELYLAALEQRLSSRLRIALALGVNFVSGFGLGTAFPIGYVAPALTAYVVSAGILGKEFSNGTPQLTFARPVTRPGWVLARWLACVSAMLAFNLVAVVLALVVAHSSHSPGPNFAHVLISELGGAGACAVVLGLSALSNGFADVVLLAAAGALTGVIRAWGQSIHDPDLGHLVDAVGGTLTRWIFPAVTQAGLRYETVTVSSVVLFVAVTAAWLVVAAVAAGRREITYATD